MKSLAHAVLALTLGLFFFACSSNEPSAPQPNACRADVDCAAGHCDPKSGCVACLFDSHCEAGGRCSLGECYTPSACDADEDCESADFRVCDPGRRECVRCLTDEQCGDSAHCRDGGCEKFEKCAAEKDCSAGNHCDLGSGECVSCLTRGDCTVGNECVQGECKPSCRVEADCAASASHCTSAGHCGECAADAHCPDVYHCEAGACVRDACAQGVVSCSEDLASVSTCSANGDASSVSRCPTGQSCVAAEGAAACRPWVCAPGSARCSTDGSTVETCAADGLSVEKTTACEDGQRCVAGRCAQLVCEPNAAFCQDGSSYTCSFDGTESTLTRACTPTEHCNAGTGKCESNRCTPGQKTCRDHAVGTCRENGSGYDYSPCGATQACIDGACLESVCVPDAGFCSGKDVRRCNATGTASTKQEGCSDACVTSGTYAFCASTSCTPGALLCDGNTATVCKPDGSGPESGGVSCASVDGYCDSGLCKPYLCTPGARSCQGQYMYQCSGDGLASYLVSSYSCDTYYWNYTRCQPSTGTCQYPACTAGTKSCNGSKAYSCDASGFVSTEVEDCAASGEVCVQGECVAKQCNPGTYFCKGGNTYYCSDGVNSSLQYTCAANQWCLEGYQGCQADACVAGQPACNGNAVSTCASDGSGPVGAGTPCPGSQVCVEGACKAVTCAPNQLVCLNGHVQACNATGTAASLYQYCVTDTYCDAASPSCKPDVCPSGKPFCDGEAFKTCKADGSGTVDAGTACSATNKVCTLSGCAATALDPIGTAGSIGMWWGSADTMYGNLIKVSQRRKLTKMEMSLEVTNGPVTAHWLVYSSTDGVTYYQASDTAASLPSTADTWVSSGALNVTLEPGLYYWIGVEFIPSGTSYAALHVDSLSTPSLSFATVLGNAALSAAGPPANFKPTKNANLYYVRLSTTLP